MPGKNSLNEFRARLESMGFLKPSLCQVKLFGPATLGDKSRELAFTCMSSELPDVGIVTQDIRRWGYGPREQMPVRPVFTNLSLTYILDAKGSQLKYFQKWMSSAITWAHYETMSDDDLTTTDGQQGAGPYELCYRDDIVTDIVITTYDTKFRPRLKYRLRDAWPKEIRNIQLSWDAIDKFMTATIVFAFTDYKVSGTNLNGDEDTGEEDGSDGSGDDGEGDQGDGSGGDDGDGAGDDGGDGGDDGGDDDEGDGS